MIFCEQLRSIWVGGIPNCPSPRSRSRGLAPQRPWEAVRPQAGRGTVSWRPPALRGLSGRRARREAAGVSPPRARRLRGRPLAGRLPAPAPLARGTSRASGEGEFSPQSWAAVAARARSVSILGRPGRCASRGPSPRTRSWEALGASRPTSSSVIVPSPSASSIRVIPGRSGRRTPLRRDARRCRPRPDAARRRTMWRRVISVQMVWNSSSPSVPSPSASAPAKRSARTASISASVTSPSLVAVEHLQHALRTAPLAAHHHPGAAAAAVMRQCRTASAARPDHASQRDGGQGGPGGGARA